MPLGRKLGEGEPCEMRFSVVEVVEYEKRRLTFVFLNESAASEGDELTFMAGFNPIGWGDDVLD